MFRSGSTSRGLSLVGMDIGRRGVRVVQLMGMGRHAAGTDAGRQWRLCRAFCWDGSSGSRDGGVDPAPAGGVIDLLRSPGGCSELGGRLRRILRQNEFRGRNLAVGISSPAIETHALELPIQGDKSGDSSLQQAAHWEIERLMRFGQGEAESDFWLLPAGETKLRRGGALPPGQPTAIGVAVEKTVVSGVWSACTSAGMVCQRLDAGLCALSRFGSWLRSLPVVGASLSEPSAAEVWGLLDLGAAQVRLVLCVGDVPVLVRCFDTGGERWVTRLSETLGLSPAAAEIHLRDHGISTKGSGRSTTEEPGRGVRGGAGDVGEAAVASEQLGGIIRNILGEELDGLCGEIERSYRYALQCHPGAEPSELILVGGGAELRNLDGYLQDRLGIEVNAAGRRLERTELGEERGVETAFIPRAAAGKRYPLSVIAGAIGLAIPPGVNLRGGVETGAVRKKVVAVS